MLLAVDVGNTNAVFAVYDGMTPLGEFRCSSDHTRTADEYFVWLKHLMDHAGIKGEINEVIISSTVPRVVYNLRVLSDRYFNTRPMVVGKPGVKIGPAPRVDPHVGIGPDRLVNCLAGFNRYGGNLIIVDFGTATTFDVADQDGAYVGGVIAPGVNISMEAFHHAAAALPHVDVSQPARVVGTNTVDCMQSGIFWGYIGLVEGICKRICDERGQSMKVIFTGGLSTLFAQGTDVFDHLDTDLTVHGLVLIASLNRKNNNG